MKIKILLASLLFLSTNYLIYSQDFYTIPQIKDTLIKYPNVFEAFSRLIIWQIPVEAFKQDTFLMSKSYELFEIAEFRKFVVIRNTKEEREDIIKFPIRKKYLIEEFIDIKQITELQKAKLLDSIMVNNSLSEKYLDSAFNFKFQKLAIGMQKYNWKTTDYEYIIFHSKLMTQRSYDTIRAYYDRFYKNSLDFTNPVLIALINMGDPEIRAKYDSIFNQKFNTKTISYDDLQILDEFENGYSYKMLAKLLYIDDFYVQLIGPEMFPLNSAIVYLYFPNFDFKLECINPKIEDSILGPTKFIIDKKKNIEYTQYKISYEEISKYFLEYAEYMEKKEQILYNQIKYKTNQ